MSSVPSLGLKIREMKKLLRVADKDDKLTVAEAIIQAQGELLVMYSGMIRRNAVHKPPSGIDSSGGMGDKYKMDTDHHKFPEPTSTLNPDGKSRACSCGARHTSQPNYHMNYCELKEY